MINRLFFFCTDILQFLGKRFRLNYLQISVIVNLYIQGGLLTLSGIAPFVVQCYALTQHPSPDGEIKAAVLLVYALFYGWGFIRMLKHYKLPMEKAFYLCVEDLDKGCRKLNLSYKALNLILFVGVWLLLIGVNAWLCLIL